MQAAGFTAGHRYANAVAALQHGQIDAKALETQPESYDRLTPAQQLLCKEYLQGYVAHAFFDNAILIIEPLLTVTNPPDVAQALRYLRELSGGVRRQLSQLYPNHKVQQIIVEHLNSIMTDLSAMTPTANPHGPSLNGLKGFTRHAGLYAPTVVNTGKCPDHPMTRLARVVDTEGVYQCPLDGKKYDFINGFTKSNGEVIQGASVAEQIPDFLGSMY